MWPKRRVCVNLAIIALTTVAKPVSLNNLLKMRSATQGNRRRYVLHHDTTFIVGPFSFSPDWLTGREPRWNERYISSISIPGKREGRQRNRTKEPPTMLSLSCFLVQSSVRSISLFSWPRSWFWYYPIYVYFVLPCLLFYFPIYFFSLVYSYLLHCCPFNIFLSPDLNREGSPRLLNFVFVPFWDDAFVSYWALGPFLKIFNRIEVSLIGSHGLGRREMGFFLFFYHTP